jgi:F-box/leucine-rich repeat protein 10/11
VIKIAQNITEFPQSTFTAENLSFDKIANALGEKCKMGVVDYLDPKKKINIQMKQWRQIWAKGFERQHTIMVPHFEYAKTPLAALARVPACIRDLDLVHTLWDNEINPQPSNSNNTNTTTASTGQQSKLSLSSSGSGGTGNAAEYPKLSQHVSMMPASSFLHFHLDSGGTAMWYNVVRGEQILYLVPPSEKNLALFKVCEQSGLIHFLDLFLSRFGFSCVVFRNFVL